LISIESVAWICFTVQLARYDPEAAIGVELHALSFQTIFDDVQIIAIDHTEDDIIKLTFHCVKNLVKEL